MPIRCVYDHKRLARLLLAQRNIITRQQALECGMSEKAIRWAIGRPGGWQIVLPGIYAAVPGALTADQRATAALRYAGPGSLITGAAAVRRHGLPCPGDAELVDILLPGNFHRQSIEFVRILRSRRMPRTWRSEAGLRFAYLPRAVADAARQMQDPRELQALVCMVVQRTTCTVEHLIAELDAGPTRGTRLLRAALAEVSMGIRSTAESDLKRLIDRSDIEKPLYNPMLYLPDGTFLCSPDSWWKRHGVACEVDSLAYHLSAKDYENTTMRHNRIEAAGIRLLHWIPSTITRDPDTVLRDIRGALREAARHEPPEIITVPAGQGLPSGYRAPGPRGVGDSRMPLALLIHAGSGRCGAPDAEKCS
jgi:hypothetical protein